MTKEIIEIKIIPLIRLDDFERDKVKEKLRDRLNKSNNIKPFNFRGFVVIEKYKDVQGSVYTNIEPIDGTPGEHLRDILLKK